MACSKEGKSPCVALALPLPAMKQKKKKRRSSYGCFTLAAEHAPSHTKKRAATKQHMLYSNKKRAPLGTLWPTIRLAQKTRLLSLQHTSPRRTPTSQRRHSKPQIHTRKHSSLPWNGVFGRPLAFRRKKNVHTHTHAHKAKQTVSSAGLHITPTHARTHARPNAQHARLRLGLFSQGDDE